MIRQARQRQLLSPRISACIGSVPHIIRTGLPPPSLSPTPVRNLFAAFVSSEARSPFLPLRRRQSVTVAVSKVIATRNFLVALSAAGHDRSLLTVIRNPKIFGCG